MSDLIDPILLVPCDNHNLQSSGSFTDVLDTDAMAIE